MKASKPLESLQVEADMAWLYGQLAEVESKEELAVIYRSMAETEQGHLKLLAARAGVEGVSFPPGWRVRVLAWLARRFGVSLVLPLLAELEVAVARAATRGKLTRESLRHEETIRTLALRGGGSGAALTALEGRHHGMGGNALRAAVLGANDGLVSNFCLVMGVAGATADHTILLLTGLAGLLAGAISMSMGEWLSVKSSRELYQRQIEIEREELIAAPEEEARELALLYQAKGFPASDARSLADSMMANEGSALDAMVREELGIDPDELGGSAWMAAFVSFALFAVSAIIPVLPFFWLDGVQGVTAAAILSTVALFGMGAAISVMTGRSALFSGARQVLFGLTAAALTYGIGRLFGVALR